MKNICIILICANFSKNAKQIYNKSNQNNKISMLAAWFGILPRFSSPSWKILSIISNNPSWYLNHWLNTLRLAVLCWWQFLKGLVSNYLAILSSIFVSKCLAFHPPTHTRTYFINYWFPFICSLYYSWSIELMFKSSLCRSVLLPVNFSSGYNRDIKLCFLENVVYLVG